MSTASYILGIVAALLTLGVVIEMLATTAPARASRHLVADRRQCSPSSSASSRRRSPGRPTLVGVEVPTNLVFFVSLVVLFLVCVQHSTELTRLEDKVRVLAEESALTELRLSRIESVDDGSS